VITADGAIQGWIGGGCAQPIVLEEARRALREGTARLVRITPHPGTAQMAGMVTYEMVCHSGGTLDIFVEPVLPMPQLVIVGRSPIARTLARLAKTLGWRVQVASLQVTARDFPDVDGLVPNLELSRIGGIGESYVVVSSQGEDDEGAMLAAVRAAPAYVGFVASAKKWQAISGYLAGQGVSAAALQRVRVPAGVPIQAVDPEEIALSIMAELVQRRREAPAGTAPEPPPARQAVDPVCHMTVDPASAKYTSDYKGQPVYFCCGGCKQSFDKDPERYLRHA
jgi:xanthine dehydrogenase accessory factor